MFVKLPTDFDPIRGNAGRMTSFKMLIVVATVDFRARRSVSDISAFLQNPSLPLSLSLSSSVSPLRES